MTPSIMSAGGLSIRALGVLGIAILVASAHHAKQDFLKTTAAATAADNLLDDYVRWAGSYGGQILAQAYLETERHHTRYLACLTEAANPACPPRAAGEVSRIAIHGYLPGLRRDGHNQVTVHRHLVERDTLQVEYRFRVGPHHVSLWRDEGDRELEAGRTLNEYERAKLDVAFANAFGDLADYMPLHVINRLDVLGATIATEDGTTTLRMRLGANVPANRYRAEPLGETVRDGFEQRGHKFAGSALGVRAAELVENLHAEVTAHAETYARCLVAAAPAGCPPRTDAGLDLRWHVANGYRSGRGEEIRLTRHRDTAGGFQADILLRARQPGSGAALDAETAVAADIFIEWMTHATATPEFVRDRLQWQIVQLPADNGTEYMGMQMALAIHPDRFQTIRPISD